MLHHHGGAGGSPYTSSTSGDAIAFSLPPPPSGPISFASIQRLTRQLQPPGTSALAELPLDGSSGGGAADLHDDDDDMPADAYGASETGAGASGSGSSTRWPREETLALIRIRSELDAAFRNAPLKAPLWEDVARKLAALGYRRRSAKKCKEKFENVDKYYRRTKEARAGRQDGKSYRFFSELEALHAAAPQRHQQAAPTMQADPQPSATAMAWMAAGPVSAPPGPRLPDLRFSWMSGSESESDDEFDVRDAAEADADECDREMMALFEGMMRQVTEKQEAMQHAFLETLERWEAERTAREEAWRRQEVARMNHEREQLAKERAAAASRDAALIAFLERVGGGGPHSTVRPPSSAVAVPTPMPDHTPLPSPRQDAAAASSLQVVSVSVPPPKSEEAWAWTAGGDSGGSTSSSRWPKEEVQALIQLRAEKDEQQYHDTGTGPTKGPLWEDIAAGMRRIGYSRSAKRCKEKWENINKYFKKVKESNKRRPEDSKTCPYFHQLDAMYRKKQRFAGTGGVATTASGSGAYMTAAVAGSGQASPSQREIEGKSGNDVSKQNIVGVANVHAAPGNGEKEQTTIAGGDGIESTRAEDTERETNLQLQQRRQEFAGDETDSDDDMEGNYYTDEGNGGDSMQYKTWFQKPHVTGSSSGNTSAPTAPATAATSSAAPTGSTFLAVQ